MEIQNPLLLVAAGHAAVVHVSILSVVPFCSHQLRCVLQHAWSAQRRGPGLGVGHDTERMQKSSLVLLSVRVSVSCSDLFFHSSPEFSTHEQYNRDVFRYSLQLDG